MAATPDEIVAFCDDLLDSARFGDYGPNGLQVPGAETVTRIATGVSAGLELFERARDAGAQLVLVHHGLFWSGGPEALTRTLAGRLRALLVADISLVQYHLPLDAHPELGNNALLADALGLTAREPFVSVRGQALGVRGTLPGDGLSAAQLTAAIRAATGDREPLHVAAGPDLVKTLGIVSGGAAREVVADGAGVVDAVLTGEPTESVFNDAREAGLHFYAAGHYATETLGIRALGDRVATAFGLDHVWIDVPNPI